jgi:pilus assembly protein CpaB
VRRISPATVTFGVMAIVLGLVAAYVVRQAMHKPPVAARPAPPPPAPEEKVAVVYALYNIPKHTRVRLTDLAVSMVPKDSKLVEGTFRFSSAAEGRIAKDTIRAGQAVRNEHLLGIGEALPDLADRLPEGHRAVTIIVQGSETGGKRLSEGDYIDLAMTVEGTHPDIGEVMTRTLMHNVLVVDAAAGQPLVRGPRRSNPPANLDSVITVAVLPAEANKLIVAQRTGTLHATLVSNLDAAAAVPVAATDDAVSRRELLGLKEIVAPRKFTVEKWTGGKMQVLEMSDDRVQESRAVTGGEAPVSAPAPRPETPSRQASGVKQPTPAPELDLVPAETVATTEVATN